MPKNPLELYQEYFVDKDFERQELFQLLREKYGITSAIYLGSFVHVTPAFIYPMTTYVEMDKRARKFFENPDLNAFINARKIYAEDPQITFYAQDYQQAIAGEEEKYDLLISQYAGFVSRYGKRYLKIGGLLLANNSHGDASMALLDDDFASIGVVLKQGSKYRVSEENLSQYFIPKKPIEVTVAYLEKIQKGVAYTKTASSYLFRRIK